MFLLMISLASIVALCSGKTSNLICVFDDNTYNVFVCLFRLFRSQSDLAESVVTGAWIQVVTSCILLLYGPAEMLADSPTRCGSLEWLQTEFHI